MESDINLDLLEECLEYILTDKGKMKDFIEQKGQAAQEWLDHMQLLVDRPSTSSQLRSSVLATMLRLSKRSGLHPTCLTIQNVRKLGNYPIAAGGFGDVWKGTVGESSENVCLKVVKIYLQSDVEKLCKAYLREAIVWRQLQHPNVLPFLGIYYLENNQQVCLISPWMEKGNLLQYVKNTPRENVEHYSLVFDVANGLSYLHSREVVHADLKAVNVLIMSSGRACIGDFGLAHVLESYGPQITTSTTLPAGTSRWLSPELLGGGDSSKESDVYAYGCVCYEIFTGLHPFPHLAKEGAVVLQVVQGKYSPRPKDVPELNDDMWALMESCWKVDPSARPTADEILSGLQPDTWNLATSTWGDSLSHQIWNNVDHQIRSTILPGSAFEFPPPPIAHRRSLTPLTPLSTPRADSSPPLDIAVQPDHFYDGQPIYPILELNGKMWLDPDDDRLAARGIPVFKPTMEEFKDFEAYMKRVEPWGMISGIIKVIPPQEWRDSLPPLKEQLSGVKIITSIEQRMSGQAGLFRQQNFKKRKPMSVREWVELCGQDEYCAPGVEEVGLHGRGNVKAKLHTKTRKPTSKAEAVEPSMDVDETVGDVAVSIHESDSRSSDDVPGGERRKLKTKGRRQWQAKQTKEAELAERVEKDKAFLETFDPNTHWLPPDTKPEDYTPEFCAKLERQYWRHCGLGKPPWCGADIQGSLYTDDTKEWNVSRLESELSRLLPSSDVIPGVNTPYLYFGMWRATYAWHVEDMDLFGIYYLHFGAPRFWYAVPQDRATSLENVMRSFFPSDASQCPQFLRHKSFSASPTFLAKSSCKPNHCVQHAGEFMITYPRGYHASFDLGLNCTESVNFALASWLELGRVAKACECIPHSVRIDVDKLLAERDGPFSERGEGSGSLGVSTNHGPGTSSRRSKRPPPDAKAPSTSSKKKRTKVV